MSKYAGKKAVVPGATIGMGLVTARGLLKGLRGDQGGYFQSDCQPGEGIYRYGSYGQHD
jgi:hypothetical protein